MPGKLYAEDGTCEALLSELVPQPGLGVLGIRFYLAHVWRDFLLSVFLSLPNWLE